MLKPPQQNESQDAEWFASRQVLGLTDWPPTIEVRFTTWVKDQTPTQTIPLAVTYRSGKERLFVYDE